MHQRISFGLVSCFLSGLAFAQSSSVPARLAWSDFDGDGLADLVLGHPGGSVCLLANRGDGSFDDVTEGVGLGGIASASFFLAEDVDRDEDPDLLIGTSAGSRLFSNGAGVFVETTRAAGLWHQGASLGASFLDYDQDGLPDLQLTTESQELLYHNLGQGFFEPVDLGVPASKTATALSVLRTSDEAPVAEHTLARVADSPTAIEAPLALERAGRRVVSPADPAGDSAGGSSSATPFPACAQALVDQGGPGCLYASSVPTLGRLFPLSSDLFIDDATGFVGIGTTSPLVRLQVQGQAGFQGGIFVNGSVMLGDDDDGIQFPASTGTNVPMITMFSSGISNADRMVIAHSPGAPTYGLFYEDDDDKFHFQMMPTDPTFTIDLGQSIDSSVDMTFRDDDDSITFPASSGSNAAMIHMFASGTTNTTRMALAHSPILTEWGLKVDDTADSLVFQQSNAAPVLTADIDSKNVTVHDGTLAVTRATTGNVLDVQSSTSSNPRTANVQRTTALASAEDVLQLVGASGSSTSAQLIEAEIGTDLEFRVDADGDVFADGAYTGPADFAEMMRVATGAESVEPGDLLALDPNGSGGLVRSSQARSTRVVGVYSTRPGFLGSEQEWDQPASADSTSGERVTLEIADMARMYDEVPVAIVGIVPAKVSAESGPIRPGDLLVASSTPGHAMRADHPEPGTIVGKALAALDSGTGTIRVLVTLQ